jgi:hypothetical protein
MRHRRETMRHLRSDQGSFGAALRCAILAASALGTACADVPTATRDEHTVRLDSAWVTEGVYARVDPATRLLRLQTPDGQFVGLAAANSLAVAESRFLSEPTLVGNVLSSLQSERGGPVDLVDLRVCERATYAGSPFGDFPPPIPGWVRRALGAHWAIPMCGSDGAAQLSVGVPDEPRDLRVVDGHLAFRQFGGGSDIDVAGVPARFPSGLPLTPEEAIAATFSQTGVRIRDVPISYNQYRNGAGTYALCASWRVALERPVAVRSESTGATTQVDELFVRRTPSCYADSIGFYIPAANQPPNRWVRFPQDTTGLGDPQQLDSALVPLQGPIVFERVGRS